ncbi:hypothetical protein TWF173_008581 [Orbilia oligospora]|nr:hypothetical protein TWF173_008581 [Orbilia oligospora]
MQHFSKADINELIVEHVKKGSWRSRPTPTQSSFEILVDWGKEKKAPSPTPGYETKPAPPPQPTAKAPAPQPTVKAQAPQPTAKAPPPPPPKLAAAPLQPTAKAPAAPQPIQAPAPGPSTPSSLQLPPAGVNVQETAPAIPNHSKRQDDPTPSNNDPNQGPVQGDATNTATSSVALGEGAYPTPKGTPAIPESPMKEAVQHWKSKASIRNALEYIPLFTSDLLRSASDVALPPQFAVFGKFLGPESADSRNMRTAYANIPNVTIREFQLNPSQLNIDTMFDLMSVRENSGLLYMDIVRRVLRDMAIENNATNKPFDYDKFKKLLFQGELVGMQSRPLKQRLTILESFIGPKDSPNLFHATPGTLTILDLTCPFVDSETACVLFGICNQLFTSAPKLSGKIIALDEAHRYMTDNASASVKRFAESIIGNIRLERHLGLRTIVSTQDPFIHPEIMELSSMVIFHRFDIPRWFEEIRKHVGFQTKAQAPEPSQNVWGDEELQKPEADIFGEIKGLDTGEACIYCPKLVIPENSWGVSTLKKFGNGVFKVMIRQKITIDGGASKNVL